MVFISYSSADANDASLIKNVLVKNGINAWMAPESIPYGSNYTKEIPKAISACSVFLLVLSDNAQKSMWVSAEVERAFKCGKIIMPFVIEDCALQDDFDFLLSRSQRITAYEKKSEALENLVNRLKSLLQITDTHSVEPSPVKKQPENTETQTDEKGNTYIGPVVDGKRSGKGKLIWANGDVYEGDFVNGYRTGKGKYTFVNGDLYEGDFQNSKREGKGTYTWKSGKIYTGDFIDNKRTGKGKLTFPNGDTYEGDFVNGSRTGIGTYIWANGDVYKGDFVDDVRTGKGKFTWANGDVYEGDFEKGNRTGKGKYTWVRGSVYEGDFLDNKRTGNGKITFPDGRVYEGDFIDGSYEGNGKFYWTNGDVFEGEFKTGNFHNGTKWDKNGNILGQLVNGKW